ncbi:MAG: hypothetical protein WA405_10360 [Candidatus Acidiferrales bacterium]
MSLNINMFTPAQGGPGALPRSAPGTVACPECVGNVPPRETQTGWQSCPYCEKRLQIRAWPVVRSGANATAAMPDQATCFFHPDKAFQACCQRCGRFVCALCDLQLGAEHVCPTCFERGRTDTAVDGAKAEWRHRDVLYDSIALSLGWLWILVWPLIVAALPGAIFLHVKYRKAPHLYLIPRSGWRFWMAYVGFAWLPLLILCLVYLPRWMAVRH